MRICGRDSSVGGSWGADEWRGLAATGALAAAITVPGFAPIQADVGLTLEALGTGTRVRRLLTSYIF